MIVLDYSIIWQILLFLLLWAILNKVLFRPYLTLLDERERQTAGAHDESFALEHDGEQLRVQYEQAIAKEVAAGNTVKESIIQEARQQREALLSHGREEAARILEQARLDIQNQLAREHELAMRESEAVAQDMVQKILGRRVG
jgi:F-type H+-transporting ATPase subunit b